MKTIFYITGTSRGIGKSMAELALNQTNSYVVGFSRTQSINHKNYTHISVDLSDPESLLSFQMPTNKEASKAVLINNSGMLGQVKPLGTQTSDSIFKTHTLNTIAPTIITNQFIKAYSNTEVEKVIVNISSGAARHAVESWANYCSSKAALDMLSQVVNLEQKENNLRIFSIAPGVVDTKMQDEIRTVSPEDFPHLNKFINYKAEGQLVKSDNVAKLIYEIIKNPDDYRDVILDLREL